MSFISPASPCFESARPPALSLPHLITALDAELIGKVTHLTRSKPGLWNVPAPFDEHDVFDNTREGTPLAAWAEPLNQGELQAFGPFVAEAVFGAKLMFVDSAADQELLTTKAVTTGRRLETGAYVTQGYQDLEALPEILDRIGWALIPIGPERGKALFITSPAKADLIVQLREWCERGGRNVATLQLAGEFPVLDDRSAPEKPRANAIAHRVDGFLGDLETVFGPIDSALLPVIEERIQARRKLREEIGISKQSPASH